MRDCQAVEMDVLDAMDLQGGKESRESKELAKRLGEMSLDEEMLTAELIADNDGEEGGVARVFEGQFQSAKVYCKTLHCARGEYAIADASVVARVGSGDRK